MNEVEFIRKLAQSADAGPEMNGDVTDDVMASLRHGDPRSQMRGWRLSAAAGCVVAVIAMFGATQAWSSLFNPLSDLNPQQTPAVLP
jgi:hypothetical protein